MGLDTTHDAWHGGYGRFQQWREALGVAAGYELVARADHRYDYLMPGWDDTLTEEEVMGHWSREVEDPLLYLLWHSDCEGKLYVKQQRLLLPRLEELLDRLPPDTDAWGYRARTEQFIAGLKLAISKRQPIGFH